MLPVAVAQFRSDGILMRYAFPVLWMTHNDQKYTTRIGSVLNVTRREAARCMRKF